jgi:hypothetical protein
MKYKSNHNVVYSCKYHVVWCPKYRRKVLVNGVDVRLKELISAICKEISVDVIEMEIMPDHVHLLLEVDPQFGIEAIEPPNENTFVIWAKSPTDKVPGGLKIFPPEVLTQLSKDLINPKFKDKTAWEILKILSEEE